MNRNLLFRFLKASAFLCALAFIFMFTAQSQAVQSKPSPVLTGQAAFTDAAHESPGIRRHLTVADLPAPAPGESVDNGPTLVPRTNDNWPIAPKGFKVELYASIWTTRACCGPHPTATSFSLRAPAARSKSFAV